MLKGIPAILPPELLKILMEMGHGDELLLADANYPRLGQPERVIRCDGHGIPELMEAILSLMPLDSYVEHPTTFMAVLPHDPYVPEIWDTYRAIGAKHEEQGLREEAIDKYTFYKRGAQTYAAVVTGERALYANVILKKNNNKLGETIEKEAATARGSLFVFSAGPHSKAKDSSAALPGPT